MHLYYCPFMFLVFGFQMRNFCIFHNMVSHVNSKAFFIVRISFPLKQHSRITFLLQVNISTVLYATDIRCRIIDCFFNASSNWSQSFKLIIHQNPHHNGHQHVSLSKFKIQGQAFNRVRLYLRRPGAMVNSMPGLGQITIKTAQRH